MNKTLLLIICDFLLLNLLALTRWDKMEPVPTQQAPVPQLKANIAAPQNDLADAMKQALENERATRTQLEERLQFAQSDVKSREQTMAQIQAQKAQLEASLNQTRQKEQELSQRFASASTEATQLAAKSQQLQQALNATQAEYQRQQQNLAAVELEKTKAQQQAASLNTAVKVAQAEKDLLREQMEKQLQQALAEKQAELERQRQALATAEQQRQAALAQAASLATAVKVAESERNMLRENVDHLKGEVATVRQEKDKIQAQTTQLAGGVSDLANKTANLTKEIQENTPINMNMLFTDFLSNRVDVKVSALGSSLFGKALREKDTKTVLVRDADKVFAIIHVNETPFSIVTPATGMSIVEAKVSQPNWTTPESPVQFWSDPRVVLIPVNGEAATKAGAKTYTMARNPFKFTEAVLISRGGKYYGEVEFKLDAANPGYVRMKNKFLNRVVSGEYSPSAGDLVMSKTGEFLGIMVNSDYCAVVQRIDPMPGDAFNKDTMPETMRPKIEEFRKRIDSLPFALR